MSRLVARALGPVLLWSTRREEKRLAAGHTYEPATIVERRNWSAPLVVEECSTGVPALTVTEQSYSVGRRSGVLTTEAISW